MRILITTDGEPYSDLAIGMGELLAELGDVDVTYLTVVASKSQRNQGRAILDAVGACDGLIRFGLPAEEILKTAEEGNFDLIVMGYCPDHGTLARWRGTTHTHLMQTSLRPVLVAKGQLHPLRRILICEGGGPQPTLVDRLMRQLPQLLRIGTSVNILHVMSQISAGPGDEDQLAHDWELQAPARALIKAHSVEGQLLASDVATLAEIPLETTPIVRHGLVVDEVVAETERQDYGLVVVGAHHPEGWVRLLLADQAQQIVQRVLCPILVIH